MYRIHILSVLLLLILVGCNKLEKEKINKDFNTQTQDINFNLKTVTICENSENKEKSPTFLFYLQLINKTSEKFAFFVQNFDNEIFKGGFFLSFYIGNEKKIIELADFWSKNPVIIEDNDTLRIMLTSVTNENTNIIWNDFAKENFLNTFNIIYYTDLKTISKDTTFLKYDILPQTIITKTEKTKIFD